MSSVLKHTDAVSPLAAHLVARGRSGTKSAAALRSSLPQVGVDVASRAGDLGLRATGSTVAFPGFLAVWGDAGSSGGDADEAQAAGDADSGSDDGGGGGGGGSTAATAAVISSLQVPHPNLAGAFCVSLCLLAP
jgi:hypothetical protein